MSIRRALVHAALVAWLILMATAPARAAVSAESILPATTVVFIDFPDFPAFKAKWSHTQVGQLLSDPAMGEFVHHLQERLRSRIDAGPAGLTAEEATDLPTGGAAFAISRDGEGKSIEWALVNVAGQPAPVAALLKRVQARLAKANARMRKVSVGAGPQATAITVYDVPPSAQAAPNTPAASQYRRLAHFERDGLLVVCTHEAAAVEAATRWNTKPKDVLAGSVTFQAVTARLKKDMAGAPNAPGTGGPDAWFFIRPMAYAETARADFPVKAKPGEPDLFQIMRNQKFHEIYGIGFAVHIDQTKYDVIARAAAFAPLVHTLQNAMRLLPLTNAAPQPAYPWLPSGVGTYIDVTWDMSVAFEGLGSLYDEYLGLPGSWKELIDDVRDDKAGPGIDLRRDLASLLGARAAIVSRFTSPTELNSRQKMLVAETTNQPQLAKNIARSLQNGPRVRSRDFNGVTLHEILPPAPKGGRPAPQGPETPQAIVAVANGALLISTHVDFMEAALTAASSDSAAGKTYFAALQELGPMLAPPYCASGFFDAAQNVESTFELVRSGRLDQDHSLLGQIVRWAASDNHQRAPLEGRKLPEFGQVKRHFTCGGFAAAFEPKFGWFGRAYILKADSTAK